MYPLTLVMHSLPGVSRPDGVSLPELVYEDDHVGQYVPGASMPKAIGDKLRKVCQPRNERLFPTYLILIQLHVTSLSRYFTLLLPRYTSLITSVCSDGWAIVYRNGRTHPLTPTVNKEEGLPVLVEVLRVLVLVQVVLVLVLVVVLVVVVVVVVVVVRMAVLQLHQHHHPHQHHHRLRYLV